MVGKPDSKKVKRTLLHQLKVRSSRTSDEVENDHEDDEEPKKMMKKDDGERR